MPDEPAAPLYSPAVVRELLARHGLRAEKRFGQNFLIDGNVLASIVAAAHPAPADTVLEVGPGLGVLTRALAATGARILGLELDARLLPVLQETVGELENVTVVPGDALEYDLAALPEGALLVANLPYNVGTAMIQRALASGKFRRLVVTVQKEVAERLGAAPGEPAYGALSLIARHFGAVARLKDVKPASFWPAPEVTSSVVRIEVRPEAQPDPALFALVRQAFRHRRKTLKKNLLMAGYPPQHVEAGLAALGLGDKVRAEALGLEAFRVLKRALHPG